MIKQGFWLISSSLTSIVSIVFGLQSNWDEVIDNFDDMSLKEDLLRGIYAYGFEKPSAIQQRAIMPCIKGKTMVNVIYK